MGKTYFNHNLPSVMFSIFLFLFAVEPALGKINTITDYIVCSLTMLCGAIWLVSFIISIVKDKQNFILRLTSKSKFSFFDIASALIGLIISYYLNPNLFDMWIFLLVLNVVFILIPNPFKQKQ